MNRTFFQQTEKKIQKRMSDRELGIWIALIHVLIIISLSPHLFSATQSVTITITNTCTEPIWPAVSSNSAASPSLPGTAIVLRPGESTTITVPPDWSGRMWGRTLCSRDSAAKLSCVTGDCGPTDTPACTATPPATTVAEFALSNKAQSPALGVYHVSLLHGFNLPMSVVPRVGPGGGNCTETGCFADLNEGCPKELRVFYREGTVGCRGACEAVGLPNYCCAAAGAVAAGCGAARSFAEFFERSCELSTISFACASNNYVIAFCPSSSHGSTPGGASSSQASSDQWMNGKDETKIYGDFNKSKRNVGLLVLAIFVAVVVGVGLVGLLFWCVCGSKEPPKLLNDFNPTTCNCRCNLAMVSVG